MMTYAEDVNYWKTSKSSVDTWLEQAKKEIEAAGGQVMGSGFLEETMTGRASFMLAFELEGERFKMLWPVLASKSGDLKAARVQSATALYHEVKAAAVKAKFLGGRAAFLAYLMLPDGKTASEAGSPELVEALPALFGGPARLLPGE